MPIAPLPYPETRPHQPYHPGFNGDSVALQRSMNPPSRMSIQRQSRCPEIHRAESTLSNNVQCSAVRIHLRQLDYLRAHEALLANQSDLAGPFGLATYRLRRPLFS